MEEGRERAWRRGGEGARKEGGGAEGRGDVGRARGAGPVGVWGWGGGGVRWEGQSGKQVRGQVGWG